MAHPRRRRSLCAWLPSPHPQADGLGGRRRGGMAEAERRESLEGVLCSRGRWAACSWLTCASTCRYVVCHFFAACQGAINMRWATHIETQVQPPTVPRRPHATRVPRPAAAPLPVSRSHAPPRAATLGEHATKLEHALPSYQREQTRQVGCGAEPLSTPPPPRARAPPGPREQPAGVAASSSSRGADSAAVAAVAASSASSAAAGGGMGSSKAAARSLRSPVPSCPA